MKKARDPTELLKLWQDAQKKAPQGPFPSFQYDPNQEASNPVIEGILFTNF